MRRLPPDAARRALQALDRGEERAGVTTVHSVSPSPAPALADLSPSASYPSGPAASQVIQLDGSVSFRAGAAAAGVPTTAASGGGGESGGEAGEGPGWYTADADGLGSQQALEAHEVACGGGGGAVVSVLLVHYDALAVAAGLLHPRAQQTGSSMLLAAEAQSISPLAGMSSASTAAFSSAAVNTAAAAAGETTVAVESAAATAATAAAEPAAALPSADTAATEEAAAALWAETGGWGLMGCALSLLLAPFAPPPHHGASAAHHHQQHGPASMLSSRSSRPWRCGSRSRIEAALRSLGLPRAFSDPSAPHAAAAAGALQLVSCALVGAGGATTCLAPRRCEGGGAAATSALLTGCCTSALAVALSATVSACKALAAVEAAPVPKGERTDRSRTARAAAAAAMAEACTGLLHWVSREIPQRLPGFVEADVLGLARHWLAAPEAARAGAHALLTASLSRADAPRRTAIVARLAPRLELAHAATAAGSGSGAAAGAGSRHVSPHFLLHHPNAQVHAPPHQPQHYHGRHQRVQFAAAAAAGAVGEVGEGSVDGLAGRDGAALVVLAVIASHYQDAVDRRTAALVTYSLVRAVSSEHRMHANVAASLLAQGAVVWGMHIREPEALFRVLYGRYSRPREHGTTPAEAEYALRGLAPLLPVPFVEVIGEEAARHAPLVCHVRSDRSVAALRLLVSMIKRFPAEMLPALPRAVESVLKTLDPGHPTVRQALMQHSTAALKEIVRRFPMTAFHQDTQRFAVGTVDALVVIYDLRTATKWRVLEGHEGGVSAVAFDAHGQRLATFSADEGRVRYWETSSSGPLGLFSSKVGRCVQQFSVPLVHLAPRQPAGPATAQAAGGLDPLGFRVVFTPTAVVLTRDGAPVCEFSIGGYR